MKLKSLALIILASSLILSACGTPQADPDQLFPAIVGGFSRASEPIADPNTDVQMATYTGPSGSVLLRARWVGEENTAAALAGLPAGAIDPGYDEALGVRDGVFFALGNEVHAAWANGDWVFILSTTEPAARREFLAAYSF